MSYTILKNINNYKLKKRKIIMAIQIPSDYYKPSLKNALMGLTSIAAFSTGIYRGVCTANGTPIDPTLESLLIWGPPALTVPLSYSWGKEVFSDQRVLDQLPPGTEAALGCTTTIAPLISGGLVRLIHGAGYVVGNLIGKNA
jgi:hypothetical protein